MFDYPIIARILEVIHVLSERSLEELNLFTEFTGVVEDDMPVG